MQEFGRPPEFLSIILVARSMLCRHNDVKFVTLAPEFYTFFTVHKNQLRDHDNFLHHFNGHSTETLQCSPYINMLKYKTQLDIHPQIQSTL